MQNTTIYDIFLAEDAIKQTRFRLKKLKEEGHRTTMAYQREYQPILPTRQRESSFPAVTNTGEVIILAENATTTSTEQEVQQKNTKETLFEATTSVFKDLDGWLALKVKNELVTQIYTSIGNEDLGINIAGVKDAISNELTKEKKINLDQAAHIDDILSDTAMQAGSIRKGNYYSAKDVDNLHMRVHVYHEVVALIEAIESTGDEGAYHLAESYIQQTQLAARNEVLNILNQQKAELEERNTSNEAKIVELQGVISTLKGEIEHTRGKLKERDEQLEDRDMKLLDNELVQHLTSKAQELAR